MTNTNDLNQEKKQQGRLAKVLNLIKENKIKTLILLIVGVVTATTTFVMFSPPDNVYKQQKENITQQAEKAEYTVPVENPLEQKQRFYETAKAVYAELDLQISAEQQFLSKRELHDLGDLAIESKYWFDKDSGLNFKFTVENMTSFLEYDKQNFEELNQRLKDAGLSETPEWKLLKRGHERIVADINYLNEVAKRILK